MMKKLKCLVAVVCVFAVLSSGVSVFAAGYDVIREFEQEFPLFPILVNDGRTLDGETYCIPTPFINGKSAVYPLVSIYGGPYYVSNLGYYMVDENGNGSKSKSVGDIYNSPFGKHLLSSPSNSPEYEEELRNSKEFEPYFYFINPEEFGFVIEKFESDKYAGTTTSPYENGTFYVNGFATIADKNFPPETPFHPYDYGYYAVHGSFEKDGIFSKVGIVNKENNIIVPMIYDWIEPVGSNGYTWVVKDGKWGIIKVDNSTISVKIDSKDIGFDQIPLIINGRTLAPLRAIFEALDAMVEWNNSTKTITATRGDTMVTMTIGKCEMYKNGNMIWLDEAPQIVGERTLVPVRAIAESFDCKVDWDGETQTVSITK